MKYLADNLTSKIQSWDRKYVEIEAPPASGKTTFVTGQLLDSFIARKQYWGFLRHKKMLILVNRRLLRKQYLGKLERRFSTHREFEDNVEVLTYQELAETIRKKRNVDSLFFSYEIVVCDEAHFFLQDSDFNGFGTTVLFHAIIRAGINQTVLFMSGTFSEFKTLFKEAVTQQKKLAMSRCEKIDFSHFDIIEEDYPDLVSFSHFSCESVPDLESLSYAVALNKGRSIVFIDDKTLAEDIAKKIRSYGSFPDKEVAILSAEKLDDISLDWVVEPLTVGKVMPRVIITTSVLDNGISIEDPSVTLVSVITESRISFLQMIFRVRFANLKEKLRIVFLERKPEFFAKRIEQLQKLVGLYDAADRREISPYEIGVFNRIWNSADKDAEALGRVFIPVSSGVDYLPEYIPEHDTYYCLGERWEEERIGNVKFVYNKFGRCKLVELLRWEQIFYAAALIDPVTVIYIQMEWINKKKEDLQRNSSSYLKNLADDLINDCRKIQSMGSKDFQEHKKIINEKYRKKLFPEISTKNGAISTEKFRTILNKFKLELSESEQKEGKVYSVKDC